ncbi:Complement C1q-like protein 4 C1q and tumor necrosis factor-related protein 11 [Channa argus]|uniref:Complement C1q-like protein 4 C1q and tumor necrosis factor-related protein 11 n=1 Tax=Channa argus TaxID=215402 RepID=A0A6G1QBT0_CHAAH|nr:Complement C1q-like protein 4 C1q and tumor necrosis factor-related protein 11 [Channa argus]
MKKIAVLILAFSCFQCETQVNEMIENNDKVHPCLGSTSCCEIYSLTSITQNLGGVGEKIANMAEKITLLEAKLQTTEKEVLELRSLIGVSPQVAFSAALRESGSGNIGPFTTAKPLQYKRVFSNTGNSYNPATGIFTAMVKGMYFFRFSMFNNLSTVPNSVVSLMKNGERLTSVWDTSGNDSHDMGSNAVVIPLNVGDNVYAELQENRIVYDDVMNYNTFSGFLLFTM